MKISVPAAVRAPRFITVAALVGLAASCGTGDKNSGKHGPVGGSVRRLSGDTTPPTVAITAPSAGDTVRDIANITVTATDDTGPVVLAQLLVNGVARQTITQPPFAFTWDGSLSPEGAYQFTVVAVDAAGNLGSSVPVNVTLRHTLATFVADTPTILGGAVGTGSFAISGPVPTGAALTLACDPPGAATFGPITLTEGTIPKSTFNITTTAQPVDTVVTVSGTYQGLTKSFTVRVLAVTNPAINALSVTSSVGGGTTASGSIRVQGAVPVTVALSSDNAAVVVPASVTVSTAGTFTSFAVNTTAVAAPTTATITATLPSGVTWTATTTVLPPMPHIVSLTGTPNPIAVGQTGTLTVTLDAPAPPGGATLSSFVWNSDSPTVPSLLIPPTLTVPEGALVGTFPVVPTPYGGSFNTQITASLNGTSATIFPYKATRTVFTGNAVYDATFRVPRCTGAVALCDTGSLVDSRDNIFLESEPNAPNTLFGSCADGNAGMGAMLPNRGLYHFDQSIDRVKVSTVDGSAMAAGKAINIEVTVWRAGRLELYSAPDANNPVWTLITSQQVVAQLFRPLTVTVPFTLPTGTLQAIRAGFGIPPTTLPPSPCSTDFQWSGYNDHDDIVFSTVDGPLTNQTPRVDAGPDQTIGLPAIAILVGKSSDDGLPNPPAAFTTTWTKVSGPGTVTFSDPNAALAAATFSIAGTYVLQLTASDGELTATDTVTVNVNTGGAANTAPTVNAGADQTIALPGGATLTGVAADDGKPNPPGAVTVAWSQVDGPGTATFANAAALVTSVDFSAAGTYTLRLSANDGLLSASDDVVVVVSPPNAAPMVNAGPDQAITLPGGATLTATVSDDGWPNPPATLTLGWSQVGGPGMATFSAPTAAATDVSFSAPGTYTLRLSASDGALSAADDVVVVVNDIPNTAPVVNAGADQTITLPGGATLAGTVSDDGRPNPPGAVAVTWSKVSGPGTVTFSNASAASTGATFSAAGTYVLRLTATDGALSSLDEVAVVVSPAPVNQAPVVNAGPDQTVTLPAAAALTGVVSDDALPMPHVVTVTWSKVSGPGTVTFANAAAASTSATFSAAGAYVLSLRASDGALATTDTVAVTVNPAITLKVQYRAVSPNATDNQIRAGLNIVNVGPTAVPLRELKIRYWYTVDTNRAQTIECESAAIGCSRITGAFTTVSPTRPGADRYLEIGFTTAAGNLAAGAQTGEIRGRIRKDNLSNYNENNDYSYATALGAAPPAALVDWSRVTLYRNGVRIWGTEP